jgi:hypothetical protein
MNCRGDCLVFTDLPESSEAMDPEWTPEPDEVAQPGDTADLSWDDPPPPVSSSDGRYGLLHRDLIWDCLGPAGDQDPARKDTPGDREDRYLPAAMSFAHGASEVTDEMDFDSIDPAYVASMGLQPSEPEPEPGSVPESEPAPLSTGRTGRNPPMSPVVVDSEPVAEDDNWWSHPDDEWADDKDR